MDSLMAGAVVSAEAEEDVEDPVVGELVTEEEEDTVPSPHVEDNVSSLLERSRFQVHMLVRSLIMSNRRQGFNSPLLKTMIHVL